MSNCKKITARIDVPSVNAFTFPEGPKGTGIKEVLQDKNNIIFVLDNGNRYFVAFPNWWFGTRNEYNSLTSEERNSKDLYFIEEGS